MTALPELGFTDENWDDMRWLIFNWLFSREPACGYATICASGGCGVLDQDSCHVNALRIQLFKRKLRIEAVTKIDETLACPFL